MRKKRKIQNFLGKSLPLTQTRIYFALPQKKKKSFNRTVAKKQQQQNNVFSEYAVLKECLAMIRSEY